MTSRVCGCYRAWAEHAAGRSALEKSSHIPHIPHIPPRPKRPPRPKGGGGIRGGDFSVVLKDATEEGVRRGVEEFEGKDVNGGELVNSMRVLRIGHFVEVSALPS